MAHNLLITGGAGFVGRTLIKTLQQIKEYEIFVIDNLSNSEPIRDLKEECFSNKCLSERVFLRDFIQSNNIKLIIHLAAHVTIRDSYFDIQKICKSNIYGTISLLEAVSECSSVERIFFSSSMAVYKSSNNDTPVGEEGPLSPSSPYGFSKLVGEDLISDFCRRRNIDYTILRLFNVFGEGQRYSEKVGVITMLVNKLVQDQDIYLFNNGKNVRDFIHVQDLATVITRLIQKGKALESGVFNVGSSAPVKILDLANRIKKELKSNSRLILADKIQHEPVCSIASLERLSRKIALPEFKNPLNLKEDELLSLKKVI